MQDALKQLKIVPVQTMEYGACLALQRRLHARVVQGGPAGYVILVEHPPVLTFGKHADKANLLFSPDYYERLGVALVDTDRGGEVTAHVPGQLVIYPILRLADYQLTPRRYVDLLEQVVTRVLASFGLVGMKDPEHPGVWVGRDKICAVGVRIKDRVSMHGIALNVCNSLDLFAKIVPCGIFGRGVTSLSRLADLPISVDEVAPRLISELVRGLGYEETEGRDCAGLQWLSGDLMIEDRDIS